MAAVSEGGSEAAKAEAPPRNVEFAIPAALWDPACVRLREPPQADRHTRGARFIPLTYADEHVECPALQVLTADMPPPQVLGGMIRVPLDQAGELVSKLGALRAQVEAHLLLRHGVQPPPPGEGARDWLLRAPEGLRAVDTRKGSWHGLGDPCLAGRRWRLMARLSGVSLPAAGSWTLEWRLTSVYVM